MDTEIKKNLYEKIQLVSNEIKNIEKNMTVGKGNYAYKAVQDIDVTLEVKQAEAKYRLVSIPIKQELVKSEIVRVVKDGGGEAIQYMDIVKMTLRIVNLDNTAEFVDVESFGRGLDPGDKGFGKASTYARKYALLNAYKIATGEDPDDTKSKEQTPVTVDEVKDAVINYMMTDSAFTQNILSYFNVGSTDDMNAKQFQLAYNNLKKKGKL
ncbi:ERF family protein [Bacteroides sp. ET71]|uniref:ERF family protein n=1 Tax=Bacteroides sp. ET71 TaxID=2939421 RepID=UPI002013162B|nr:ERF family protein [Bacteroides sp. ET71]MCL1615068.1 ERF family protein [Bacteroides sp. ET71]